MQAFSATFLVHTYLSFKDRISLCSPGWSPIFDLPALAPCWLFCRQENQSLKGLCILLRSVSDRTRIQTWVCRPLHGSHGHPTVYELEGTPEVIVPGPFVLLICSVYGAEHRRHTIPETYVPTSQLFAIRARWEKTGRGRREKPGEFPFHSAPVGKKHLKFHTCSSTPASDSCG